MQTTPYTRTAINCSSRCRAMEPPDLGAARALICAPSANHPVCPGGGQIGPLAPLSTTRESEHAVCTECVSLTLVPRNLSNKKHPSLVFVRFPPLDASGSERVVREKLGSPPFVRHAVPRLVLTLCRSRNLQEVLINIRSN